VFGILAGPVAAVPGKTLFEAVSLGDPERRLVASRPPASIPAIVIGRARGNSGHSLMQDAFYSDPALK
jgi:hypothetical protein